MDRKYEFTGETKQWLGVTLHRIRACVEIAAFALAYGRPQTVEELVARIDAVSVESSRNAARALLSRSRPAVVALGSGRGLDTAVSFAEGLTKSKSKTLLH